MIHFYLSYSHRHTKFQERLFDNFKKPITLGKPFFSEDIHAFSSGRQLKSAWQLILR